ncbi:hypothetical protein NDU88_002129 [Pleurodeles waltl]|uniref:Uncharacterized protein n=1 Tax=Pleurodeles waltl TaxID=8319 RepID=A0AAV7UVA2_PLEWA|nr:hypothetical protein NDU88_002129 [Pleurodeles waltl]
MPRNLGLPSSDQWPSGGNADFFSHFSLFFNRENPMEWACEKSDDLTDCLTCPSQPLFTNDVHLVSSQGQGCCYFKQYCAKEKETEPSYTFFDHNPLLYMVLTLEGLHLGWKDGVLSRMLWVEEKYCGKRWLRGSTLEKTQEDATGVRGLVEQTPETVDRVVRSREAEVD